MKSFQVNSVVSDMCSWHSHLFNELLFSHYKTYEIVCFRKNSMDVNFFWLTENWWNNTQVDTCNTSLCTNTFVTIPR